MTENTLELDMTLMKTHASSILDTYSYTDLMLASDDGIGDEPILTCLRNVFTSPIEDWIQDYIDARRRRYLPKLARQLYSRSPTILERVVRESPNMSIVDRKELLKIKWKIMSKTEKNPYFLEADLIINGSN